MYAVSWVAHRMGVSRAEEVAQTSEAEAVYLGTEGVVLQDGGNTCGPAALKMILDYHGVNVRLGDLERKAGYTGRGMNMSSLSRLATSFGLDARGWRLGMDDLRRSCMPAILFVENTHFVVLDSIGDRCDFFVRDPAKGKMRLSKSKLLKIWRGEALLFCGANPAIE
jgi:ABC-type bacteriocin/lantibiotic exporter with double-glycine peptidase domain